MPSLLEPIRSDHSAGWKGFVRLDREWRRHLPLIGLVTGFLLGLFVQALFFRTIPGAITIMLAGSAVGLMVGTLLWSIVS